MLDVTDALWQAKTNPGESLFLKLDTHWTPRGLAIVADMVAARLKQCLPRLAHESFDTRTVSVTNYGDLLRILEVPSNSGLFAPQTVEITQLLPGSALSRGDDASSVLLLGDSFTNIYHRQEMEWGDGAGLGEQLMLRLGTGVQVIAINGGGATAVRESLAQNLGITPQESCRLGGFLPRSLRPFHRMGAHPASRTRLSQIRAPRPFQISRSMARLVQKVIKHALARFKVLCYQALPADLNSSSTTERSQCACFDYCYLLR